MWSIFDPILSEPILNFLIALYGGLLHNLGLAIIVLTAIVRLLMLPLTLSQLRSSKKMAQEMGALQPKLQEIQKKYAKNKEKLAQETMKMYKEAGINPLGCLSSSMFLPMLIQMPIWFGVYRAVMLSLDSEGLLQHLYSWSIVHQALPLPDNFLNFFWLNLAKPDPYLLIPLLVMGTMWVSQKMVTTPAVDPKQQSMNSMMQLMFPIMFGLITFGLPSGLALYWVISSIFSIAIQYLVYGWGNLLSPSASRQIPDERAIRSGKYKSDFVPRQISKPKEEVEYGGTGDKRKDSRRSRTASFRATGTQSRGSRGSSTKGG
jgi:YidC/Oxa1 family membrane protein insertase